MTHDTAAPQTSPRAAAYVAWTLRHGKALWIAAILLAIPAIYRTAQLYMHLKSDIEALLPREAPSVLALDVLRHRTPGLQFLGVVVDTGDSEHFKDGERFIDDLAARVRAYPADLVRSVRTSDEEEARFIKKNAPLYIDVEDLNTIYERLRERRSWEELRATFGSIDDDEEPPSVDFSDIRAKYDASVPSAREGTRYSNPMSHVVVLLVQVGGEYSTGNTRGMQLFSRLNNDIREMGGLDAYAPGMRVGFAGDVATSVEETQALVADLSLSSVLVVIAVMIVLVWYYRWWRSIFVLVPPLLIATVYAFAVASLPPFGVTALNSNTAFLGSIIIGNGINFGIVFLARYVEERRLNRQVEESLVTAVLTSRTGTLAAALAAAVSYASLCITQFRGFRQFGVIGGIGMVCAWTLAYLLIPPLIAWVDKSAKTAPKPRATANGLMGHVATFVERRFVIITIAACVLTALAAIPVSHFGKNQLESDLSKLRRTDTWTRGEGYWSKKMNAVIGRYLTPMVILTDTEDDAIKIAAKLKEMLHDELFAATLASVRTGRDLVPSDQADKIAVTKKIRSLISSKMRERLSDEQKKAVDQFLGNDDLVPITLDDVPESFKTALRERDGSIGKTVVVYPKVGGPGLWDGPTLIGLVEKLRTGAESAVEPGHRAQLAGGLPISADILRYMQRDGLITSAAAMLGVIAVVLLLMRGHRISWFVVGALLLGVLYLVAITVVFKIKINFANFIAFPITFGIGVDYAINVASRYVVDGEKDVRGAIASTGGAVGLCSLTTIIGYSSLLLAQNHALFLFGLLAVLGEVTCLTVAVTVLPAVLLLMQRRRKAVQAR